MHSRPASEADLIEYYGGKPKQTIRAIMFYEGDKAVGIGGVKNEAGYFIAFSEIKDGANVSKQAIWRATMKVMNMIKELGVTVYAVPESPSSVAFLERLGFAEDGAAYRWRS